MARSDPPSNPLNSFILGLPHEIALAAEHGLPVVFVCDEEPPLHVARLMDTLGVKVEVRPVTSLVRYCPHKGCAWSFEGAQSRFEIVLPTHLRVTHNGVDPRKAVSNGHAAKPAAVRPIERGQGDAPAVRKGKAPKWTPETIIAAIQRWASEYDGRPPTSTEWLRSGEWWPTFSTAARTFGTFGKAIEAAGFPRPGGGAHKKADALTVSPPHVEVEEQEDISDGNAAQASRQDETRINRAPESEGLDDLGARTDGSEKEQGPPQAAPQEAQPPATDSPKPAPAAELGSRPELLTAVSEPEDVQAVTSAEDPGSNAAARNGPSGSLTADPPPPTDQREQIAEVVEQVANFIRAGFRLASVALILDGLALECRKRETP